MSTEAALQAWFIKTILAQLFEDLFKNYIKEDIKKWKPQKGFSKKYDE